MKDKKGFMKEYYAAPLVDAAEENVIYHSGYLDSCIEIDLIGTDINDKDKEILKKRIKGLAVDCGMDGFIYGAQYAIENKLETVHKTEDNPYDYVKNKDFCVMLDFHDNDFGGYLLTAAQTFANKYNSIINHINLYSKHSETMVESYIENLEKMEKLENITKLLQAGFIGAYNTESIDSWYKEIPLYEDVMNKSKECVEYLGVGNYDAYKIGTYKEIESYVMEHYKEQQSEGEGTSLKTCWLNGEVLFMVVIDGVMKVWVQ